MGKFSLSLSILSLITLINCEGCIDPENCPSEFHIPAEIIPYQRVYHIGDTIKMVSIFDRHVYEIELDRKFDLVNTNFNPNTSIVYLDTIGYTKISNYFDLYYPQNNYYEFKFSDGSSALTGQYILLRDTFFLEFQIIPKRLGNFLLIQKCGIGPNHGDVDFPGKCRGKGYDVIVDMNSGKDGNIDISSLSKDSLFNYTKHMESMLYFYSRGGFCFSVVP